MSEDKLDRILREAQETRAAVTERLVRLETLVEAHAASDTQAHNDFRSQIAELKERQRADARAAEMRAQTNSERLSHVEVDQAKMSVKLGMAGGLAGIVAIILQVLSRTGIL